MLIFESDFINDTIVIISIYDRKHFDNSGILILILILNEIMPRTFYILSSNSFLIMLNLIIDHISSNIIMKC